MANKEYSALEQIPFKNKTYELFLRWIKKGILFNIFRQIETNQKNFVANFLDLNSTILTQKLLYEYFFLELIQLLFTDCYQITFIKQ